jgi:transcriptional regulator with XRE-family HTH domain
MNKSYYIDEWAKYRGYSMKELAQEAGIGTATITRIRKRDGGRSSTIRKIAAALSISVEELQELPPVGSFRKTVDTVNEQAELADGFDGIIRDIGNIDTKYLIPLLSEIPEGPWETWFTGSPLELSREYVFRSPGVKGENVFAIRLSDNSMEPVINYDDVLFVNPEKEINNNNGETRLVRTDEKIMIRYVYKFDLRNRSYYRLASEKYDDQIIHCHDATIYKLLGIIQIRTF